MNSQLKSSDFIGKILANSVVLGPIAMILFQVSLNIISPDEMHSGVLMIFFFGSVICVFLSLFASVVVYGVLVFLAIRQRGSTTDHFKRFLPVLTSIFPIGGSVLLLLDGSFEPIPIAIIISAYLTSALGWYWLSACISKKQYNLNSQSIKKS